MMKLKILIFPLVISLLTAGCQKEDAIQPDELSPEYSLPQGNHTYDAQIVDFYRNYGCYILYKFTENDFRWNITSNIPFTAEQGHEDYIAPALDALDKYLFKFYNVDFLKKALPYKIILSAKIVEFRFDTSTGETHEVPANSASTFNHFAFGRAGASLTNMTEAELKQMKVDLNREFWNQAVSFDKIPIPPVFIAATNYADVQSWNFKNYGAFLKPGLVITAYSDFIEYINLILSNTPEELEQTLFLPQNDPNGKYKFKYNTIINYYQDTYGINLQSIAK